MSQRRDRKRKYVMISVVAERFAIHPQTLRLYEKEGLIQPRRSAGNTRLYDEETLDRLETILTLTRDLGVNLAGVEVILNMRDQLEALQRRLDRLHAEHRALERQRRLDRTYALEKYTTGLQRRASKG
jgi:MerR family transcriptional regulator/heat shock protein HspR